MNVMIFIQARSQSTRLPRKIFLPLGESTVLENLYYTCRSLNRKGNLVYTVVSGPHEDYDLRAFCNERHIVSDFPDCWDNDLLTRIQLTMPSNCEYIIRLTADCPLITATSLEAFLEFMSFDYSSNTSPRTVPDGFDIQGITRRAFEWVNYNQLSRREHPFAPLDDDKTFQDVFCSQGFTINRVLDMSPTILNPFVKENKLSVDTQEDYERVKAYYERMVQKIR